MDIDADAEFERLASAFPESIRGDARAALSHLPPAEHAAMCSIATTNSAVRWPQLSVGGEVVDIPTRQYHPVVSLDGALPRYRPILACIYTRHNDGFVRQQALRAVFESDEPWTAPFVVQLLGEYVLDIVADVARVVTDPPDSRTIAYARFLADNPEFSILTRARAASYWNEYYRRDYPHVANYPAMLALSALTAPR
ncbi:hypothetical protein JGU71_19025 [Antrihabitans sp. YC3-6]|uniref:Uncharacterized protein n=1 Tax=Antrihabitans stalagmiti TaxID=2799499 RepID=A0A934U5L3_9NOCA|nr:hypothetical protein [Antrihabitans stalagmiti]MBJ8340983.1 hypothetical protein [Antrihabitans stalagmiti]